MGGAPVIVQDALVPNQVPEQAGTASRSSFRSPALLLALATGLCYANSLTVPFLFDDLLPSVPLDYGTRPLVWASFALNRAISGADTWSYHLFNTLVHLGCGLLLLGLLRLTLARAAPHLSSGTHNGLALVTTLAWLCHPLQTESVTYLSQRAESMGALFYLAVLYTFIRSTCAARPIVWQALALLSLTLGFAAKEIIVTVPLVLWLYDALFLARGPLQALRLHKGFYGALALASVALAFAFIAPLLWAERPWVGLHIEEFSQLDYVRTQAGVVLHYLRLALWPHPLCFDYGWPIAKTTWDYVPQALSVGTLLLAAGVLLVRRSWIGFALAWFFLILAPTSSFVAIKDTAFEHRVYLSLAGVLALAVTAGWWFCARLFPRVRWLPRALASAALLALAAATVRRNHEYSSPIALMQSTVACAPNNDRAHSNLGGVLLDAGRVQEALVALETALRLAPNASLTHLKLGRAYLALGDVERALGFLRTAVQLEGLPVCHEFLGRALLQKGDAAWAAYHLQHALLGAPADGNLNYVVARAFDQLGRTDKARGHYEQALRALPGHEDAHLRLARVLMREEQPLAALEHYQAALAIAPDTAEEALRRGLCLAALGQRDQALETLLSSVQLAPLVPDAYAAAARILCSSSGSSAAPREKALRLARRADELARSQRPDVLEVLALTHAAVGDFESAARALDQALALPVPAEDPGLGARLRQRLEDYRLRAGR
ncbi:MAG: tetratricopeptide repeat protein [Planctomycetes bacterium]|nr:tetratricopeptide repeat protein [Planctomycetota bacterium]